MDFVVSRFSRLYPAYWGGAILLTPSVTHAIGPCPGKTVGWDVLLVNVTMVQGFFGVAHVDGVYWTLEVELLFYAWALLSFRFGGAAGLRNFLFACLALRLVYAAAKTFWGVDLPWVGRGWLLLPYICWFALGVTVYRLSRRGAGSAWDWALAAAAILVIGLVEDWGLAALAAVFYAVLFGASGAGAGPSWSIGCQRVAGSDLVHAVPAAARRHRLGGVAAAQSWDVEVHLAIALTMALSMALAHGLATLVEQPVMRWIRDRYRARRQPSTPAPAGGCRTSHVRTSHPARPGGAGTPLRLQSPPHAWRHSAARGTGAPKLEAMHAETMRVHSPPARRS